MSFQLDTSIFTPDAVRQVISEHHKGSNEDRVGPTLAYLPEGRHLIRWFFDPTAKLFREIMIGRVGKKRFVCPDFLSRVDKFGSYPTCEIDEIAKERDAWKDKCRYQCLAYGALYETKNTSEYWKADKDKPPTPYVIIGNSFLKRALLDMLENLEENGMDMLLAMLTPTAKGFYSSVTVTKGQQGNISIQVLPNTKDPIELGEWYVPLKDVLIKSEFDEKTYNEAVSEYLANVDRDEGDNDGGSEESGEDATTIATSPTTETAAEILDSTAVELSPRAPKTSVSARKTSKKNTTLPEGVTLEMLPEECPGWSNYTGDSKICALCEYNLD